MDVLAVLLALVVGFGIGFLTASNIAGQVIAKKLRREMDAGRIDRDLAQRLARIGE